MGYYAPENHEWVMRAGGRLCAGSPKGATDPLRRFISDQHRVIHLVGNIFELTKRLDSTLDDLFGAMADGEGKSIRDGLFRYEDGISQDKDLIFEILTSRSIDNFLTYVAQLLGLLFSTRPETLAHSNAEIKLKDVVKYASLQQFLEYAVEAEVRKLSYQGMRDLYRDIKDRLGFRLFEDDKDLAFAVKSVALRNLLTHNSGIVDSRFAFEAPEYKGREGQKVTDFNALYVSSFCTMAAVGIDTRAREKWNLPEGELHVAHNCHRFENASGAQHRRDYAAAARSDSAESIAVIGEGAADESS